MKLHDPATEKALLKIAKEARGSKKFQPSDSKSIRDSLNPIGGLLLTILGCALVMGNFEPDTRPEHWKTLFCCLILIAVSLTGSGTLHETATRAGCDSVLINLPIRGVHALQWIRSRFFSKIWLKTMLVCSVCSLAYEPAGAPISLSSLATALLLIATTLSTTILFDSPILHRLFITKLWTWVSIAVFLVIIVLYVFKQHLFRSNENPEWLIITIQSLSWIYPWSWVTPEKIQHGGIIPATIWISWGIIRWARWPNLTRTHFDDPQDFFGAFGEFAIDEDDENEAYENFGSMALETPRPAGELLPPPLTIQSAGWVDDWISRLIGNRHHHRAGALMDLTRTWTRQTNLGLIFAPVWCVAVWLFTNYYPDTTYRADIVICLWFATPVALSAAFFPFTNAIPRANAAWFLGEQKAPFFVGLPIRVRDLLHISTRVSIARCLIMAAVVTPLIWIMIAVLDSQLSPWLACWIVPAITCFWITSRPVFIWNRLQQSSKRRNGSWLSYSLPLLASVVLLLIWLVSGPTAIVCGVTCFTDDLTSSELLSFQGAALGGLLLSALCARATFEIQLWQVRHGVFDWLTSD